MSRLIDADSIGEEFREYRFDGGKYSGCSIGDLIDAQPTVNQWIPCSKEMPPVGKTVLVTVKTDTETWTDCDTWYQGDWMGYMGSDREVIAWCELPEPYKEADK